METKELIPALRADAEWAHANEWETPITLGDHLDAAADALTDLLAVTAEQYEAVAHGEWREDTDPADGDLRCTRCHAAWPKFVQDQIAEQGIWTLQTLFKYCPNCGAKMDGGEKHG